MILHAISRNSSRPNPLRTHACTHDTCTHALTHIDRHARRNGRTDKRAKKRADGRTRRQLHAHAMYVGTHARRHATNERANEREDKTCDVRQYTQHSAPSLPPLRPVLGESSYDSIISRLPSSGNVLLIFISVVHRH